MRKSFLLTQIVVGVGLLPIIQSCGRAHTGVEMYTSWVPKSIRTFPAFMRRSMATATTAVQKESSTVVGGAAATVGSYSGFALGKVFGGPLAMSASQKLAYCLFPHTSTTLGSIARYAAMQHAMGCAYGFGMAYGPTLGSMAGGFAGVAALSGTKSMVSYGMEQLRLHRALADWRQYQANHVVPVFTETDLAISPEGGSDSYVHVDVDPSVAEVFPFEDGLFDAT